MGCLAKWLDGAPWHCLGALRAFLALPGAFSVLLFIDLEYRNISMKKLSALVARPLLAWCLWRQVG
jgi:hypothetical protein